MTFNPQRVEEEKLIFRDLRTSIDSGDQGRDRQRTPWRVRQRPNKPTASKCISHYQQSTLHRKFDRHKATSLPITRHLQPADPDNPITRETANPVVVPEADQAAGRFKDEPGFLH
jgi:hypothetical protein